VTFQHIKRKLFLRCAAEESLLAYPSLQADGIATKMVCGFLARKLREFPALKKQAFARMRVVSASQCHQCSQACRNQQASAR
jgi:hypothetical protein